MSQFAEELRNLASPMAESLSDGRRLTLFIHAATSAADHIDSLEKELARRDMQLEASAKVALKLLSDNRDLRALLESCYNTLVELNPSNYTHDDVVEANEAAIAVILAIREQLGPRFSPEP